ncbi:hypothetical protein LSAT2_018817 [Lamellibrachia satsuma]|nr:hypothetical protein LSAT2_018817 [Lamellibrachia satsuma]
MSSTVQNHIAVIHISTEMIGVLALASRGDILLLTEDNHVYYALQLKCVDTQQVILRSTPSKLGGMTTDEVADTIEEQDRERLPLGRRSSDGVGGDCGEEAVEAGSLTDARYCNVLIGGIPRSRFVNPPAPSSAPRSRACVGFIDICSLVWATWRSREREREGEREERDRLVETRRHRLDMYSGARCSFADPGRAGVALERNLLLTSASTLGSCRDVFAASTDRLLYHQREAGNGANGAFSGAEANDAFSRVEASGRRAWRNLVVLGVSFMFLSTALVSLQSVQSSLNPHRGVGVLSLSCVHGATVVSCLLAPVVIGRLTTKWTVVASVGACLVYAIVANVDPRHSSLVSSSLLLGLLTGPMWSAQAVHLSRLAIEHADAARLDPGRHPGSLQRRLRWIRRFEPGARLPSVNESNIHSVCGAADCSRLDGETTDRAPDTAHHLQPVPTSTRHLLLCAHVGCIVVALALTATLLDSAGHSRPGKGISVAILDTVKTLADPRLLLLVPLVVFVGLEKGFVLADFTKSYINCALGVHKIGPVLVCFGSVNAVSAMCIGHVVKHVKRYPTMLSATIFNTGLFMVLLWWRPCRQDVAMFYVVAACLGLCDAIWQTQTNKVMTREATRHLHSPNTFDPTRRLTLDLIGHVTCKCLLRY